MTMNHSRRSSSYLSPNVRQLLRIAGDPCRDVSLNNQALQCIRKEGQVLVLEDQPMQYLLSGIDISDYGVRTGQWNRVVLRRLSALFNFCHEMLLIEKFSARDTAQDPTLQWCTHPKLILEGIHLLQTRDDKNVANEVFLSLTPMLERSLGNVLFTSSNKKLKIPR
jgi:hypothetical protein